MFEYRRQLAQRRAALPSRSAFCAAETASISNAAPLAACPAACPGLDGVLARLDETLAAAADTDLDAVNDRALLDAATRLQRLRAQLDAVTVKVVATVDARAAANADGAVTTASWLRHETRMDHAAASTLVTAARRLQALPTLAEAFTRGEVSLAHVTAITGAAVPQRADAIAAAETTLVELARNAAPRDVRRACRYLADIVDPDGSDPDRCDPDRCDRDPDPQTPAGPDPRRELTLRPGFDRLWNAYAALDVLTGEKLATLLDHYSTPDHADTPSTADTGTQRRSPGQIRHDAFDAILDAAMDACATTVHGTTPRVLLTMDLAAALGAGGTAAAPRLRHFGEIDPATARRVLHDAAITVLATMGPWRSVAIGRTQRTLSAWLRTAMAALHATCRGPCCDRPISWTQAHHETAWHDHGNTDLNATILLCPAHHDLVTTGQWGVELNLDNGTCTWTNTTTGHVRITHPPP